MSDITPSREMIQQEETAADASVSESTMTRVGAAINFINTYQLREWKFGAVGPFSIAPSYPLLDVGTKEVFDFDAELVGVRVISGISGTSGISEVDVKWAPVGSGVFNSIFSTTPKVDNSAADDVFFDSNDVTPLPAGCTKPVLSKTTFDQGDRLKFDIISAATGAEDLVLAIYWRVR